MKILKYGAVGGAAAVLDFIIFAIFAKYLNYNYLLIEASGLDASLLGLESLLSFHAFDVNLLFGVQR